MLMWPMWGFAALNQPLPSELRDELLLHSQRQAVPVLYIFNDVPVLKSSDLIAKSLSSFYPKKRGLKSLS